MDEVQDGAVGVVVYGPDLVDVGDCAAVVGQDLDGLPQVNPHILDQLGKQRINNREMLVLIFNKFFFFLIIFVLMVRPLPPKLPPPTTPLMALPLRK